MKYPADHPVWKIVEKGMLMVFLLGFGYLNCNKFSADEILMAAEVFGAILGFDAVKGFFTKKRE